MAWHDSVKTGIGIPAAAGLAVMVFGLGGFGAWAAMAPLQGAVIAPAKIAVSGHNKVVQHFEGGIVKEILVAEGENVSAGDPLLILDGTASHAMVNHLRLQLAAIEVSEIRASAERESAQTIVFPDQLEGASPTDSARLIADQRIEFEARLESHRVKQSILRQQIAAIREAIVGHETEKHETEKQIVLIAEERKAIEALLEQGLTRKSQVLSLQRLESDLLGKQGQLGAAIAKARQSLAEIEERIAQADTTRVEEASAALSGLRRKRSEIIEQLRSAEDVNTRLVVRAPASGTVMDLAKYNPGAVISPGQELMRIVPIEDGLIVEAQVRLQDIDQVRIGQPARLDFSRLRGRGMQPVAGTVSYISADRREDERSGEAYYVVRLDISEPFISGADSAFISPGQSVDVFITTDKRTFLAYLTEPFANTLRRALRES